MAPSESKTSPLVKGFILVDREGYETPTVILTNTSRIQPLPSRLGSHPYRSCESFKVTGSQLYKLREGGDPSVASKVLEDIRAMIVGSLKGKGFYASNEEALEDEAERATELLVSAVQEWYKGVYPGHVPAFVWARPVDCIDVFTVEVDARCKYISGACLRAKYADTSELYEGPLDWISLR